MIVYADFDDMDFAVGDKVVAKIHHVVLDFGRPIVSQSIFSAEAKHPSVECLVSRSRGPPTDAEGVAGLQSIDSGVGVGPGAAHFAVDEPLIEGPAGPRSERGNPVELRDGVF